LGVILIFEQAEVTGIGPWDFAFFIPFMTSDFEWLLKSEGDKVLVGICS